MRIVIITINLLEYVGGEVLPVEQAILKNAEGRGLCNDVKKFITKGENKIKSEVIESEE